MFPPHEIKAKEFTHVLRGYSAPEVDEYTEFVLQKYTELYRENDALENRSLKVIVLMMNLYGILLLKLINAVNR